MGSVLEDYCSDRPPARPIGVECEYNLQIGKDANTNLYEIINPQSLTRHGVANHAGYIGSEHGSGRMYGDVGHAELAAQESMGPASASVEDIAGIGRLGDLLDDVDGCNHISAYRIAGSFLPSVDKDGNIVDTKGETSGYHVSYLTPRASISHPLFKAVTASHLASAIWTSSGTLRPEGFVFSQKVWGIGGEPVSNDYERRTDHGNKPMILVPSYGADKDVVGDINWTRAEVRLADPGLSIVNRYLSFASMSLAMRIIEHGALFSEDQVSKLCLRNPSTAARIYAGDLTLRSVQETQAETTSTAVDIQEALLDLYESLDQRIELPADESRAIPEIRLIIDGLRASRPDQAEYAKIIRSRTDFAPKHQFICRGIDPAQATVHDDLLAARNLMWDRVYPAGIGMKYWSVITERDPLAADIIDMAAAAGQSKRAQRRARMIDESDGLHFVRDWSTYIDTQTNTVQSLGEPHGM